MKADETDFLPGRAREAASAWAYILAEFPRLAPHLPAEMPPFARGFGEGDGRCTHPELLRNEWLRYHGGSVFVDAEVPDGFAAAAIKNSGGSEYVIVMWRQGGRRFWFQDQYANFHGGGASQEATRQRVEALLARWDAGTTSVAASGDTDLI